MIVQTNPDGTWTIDGVSFDEVRKINPNLYGALCKLKDYEATGLEPSDFRADKYEKTYAYKVHYSKSNSEDKTIHTILCQSRAEADRIAELLKSSPGYNGVGVNKWIWQMFIED